MHLESHSNTSAPSHKIIFFQQEKERTEKAENDARNNKSDAREALKHAVECKDLLDTYHQDEINTKKRDMLLHQRCMESNPEFQTLSERIMAPEEPPLSCSVQPSDEQVGVKQEYGDASLFKGTNPTD